MLKRMYSFFINLKVSMKMKMNINMFTGVCIMTVRNEFVSLFLSLFNILNKIFSIVYIFLYFIKIINIKLSLFSNICLNQKKFYNEKNLNIELNFLDFFILKYEKSSLILGLDEILKVVILKATVLKKHVVKKKNKTDFIQYKKNVKSIDYSNNYNFTIQKITGNHPKVIEILTNSKSDFRIVIGNLTTKNKDATLLAEKGILSQTNEIYLYDEVNVEILDENNIQKIRELVFNYKDFEYSQKISFSDEVLSNYINLIESKVSVIINQEQKIFLKSESIEKKIDIIENFIDNINKINNKED